MDKGLLYGVGIFIPVTDLERSTQWYRKMLGLEILIMMSPSLMF